jgi:hypothetical protein
MECVRENHLQFLLSLSVVPALYGTAITNVELERCGGQGMYCKQLPGEFEERNKEILRTISNQLSI